MFIKLRVSDIEIILVGMDIWRVGSSCMECEEDYEFCKGFCKYIRVKLNFLEGLFWILRENSRFLELFFLDI